MFKIYDLNMKEIPLPKGVMPLEIFVGSVAKDRVTEAVEGRTGVVDYGFNYTDRPVSLFLRIKAADAADFRLLRNEVFATFDVGSAFYVAEADVPSRVLKVVVDESYIPDRLTEEYADFDINCRTLDSVFWETIYTTLELHDSGYSATAEKYGLVDNIDDEKVKYRFTPREVDINFNSSSFQNGNIHNGRGDDLDTLTDYARTVGFLPVIKNSRYRIVLEETSGNAEYVRLFHYNADGSFISNDNRMTSVSGNGKSEYNFTALGEKLRLVIYPVSGKAISLSDIGSSTKISMYGPSTTNTLSVYNAGNVTVEPENMMLNIIANGVQSTNNFTIRNNTTGEEIVLKRASDGSHYRIQGMVISLGSTTNVFRDTNRRFISLVPGDNQFEILNGTFEEMRFNFKYYYK